MKNNLLERYQKKLGKKKPTTDQMLLESRLEEEQKELNHQKYLVDGALDKLK